MTETSTPPAIDTNAVPASASPAVAPKPWYFGKPVVILSLLAFCPLGLFLMWKGRQFTVPSRWVITAICVIAVIYKWDPSQTHAAASGAQAGNPRQMASTLDGFEAEIPIMKKRGRQPAKADLGAAFMWRDLSVFGNKNWIRLDDANGDNVPEIGLLGVTMIKDDRSSILEAMALAFKVVSVASAEQLDVSKFSDWLTGAVAGTEATRTFGNVVVTVRREDAGDGSIILIGLNQ